MPLKNMLVRRGKVSPATSFRFLVTGGRQSGRRGKAQKNVPLSAKQPCTSGSFHSPGATLIYKVSTPGSPLGTGMPAPLTLM